MAYNISFINSANTVGDVVGGAIFVEPAILGALLAGVYLLLFAFLKNYDTVVSMIISGFGTSIISSLLFFAGWLSWKIAVVPLFLFIISVAIHFFRD